MKRGGTPGSPVIDRPCPTNTRAGNVVSSDRFSQHGENNKSKRSLCVCIVCVKINNDELFCNAFPVNLLVSVIVPSIFGEKHTRKPSRPRKCIID